MPTKEEIQDIINKLKEMAPNIRQQTAFGDDNRAAIEAQIKVLAESMDEDDIYDRWPEDEGDMYVRSSALDARAYLDGEELEGDGLVEDWESLIVK